MVFVEIVKKRWDAELDSYVQRLLQPADVVVVVSAEMQENLQHSLNRAGKYVQEIQVKGDT